MIIVPTLLLGLSIALSLWGTLYALWRFLIAKSKTIETYPPVSILKPLKGVDPGLADNLASFLEIDYPQYEVIFSATTPEDPAVEVVLGLAYAGNVRLIINNKEVGINPKVNNLVKSERLAHHDHLLVSDSNIRAHKSYLKEMVPYLSGDVGIVSTTVCGFGGEKTGGKLEEMHLNTYYVRWMSVAASVGMAFVLGKSMFYRRSVAKEFGGIGALANYLAEDYMMGLSMYWIGKEIKLMGKPVHQYVGRKTIKDFWQRNYRWCVLQKHNAPYVFVVQPFSFAFVAAAFALFWGWKIALASVLYFFLLDMIMCLCLGTRPSPIIWVLKEVLSPLIWIHATISSTVEWRGSKLKVLSKGMVKKA